MTGPSTTFILSDTEWSRRAQDGGRILRYPFASFHPEFIEGLRVLSMGDGDFINNCHCKLTQSGTRTRGVPRDRV